MRTIKKIFLLPVFIILTVSACRNDEDIDISKNPYDRIIGSWELEMVNTDDVSSQNIVWTFLKDGKWTASKPTTFPMPESGDSSVAQVFSFEDGWVYDTDNDVISGYMALSSPSSVSNFPYRFEINRKQLMISFEPRDVNYVVPPTPLVYYFKKE